MNKERKNGRKEVELMSIRFEKFTERIARKSNFKPFRNMLLNVLKDDAIAKYKRYPELIERMKELWAKKGYKNRSDISGLIRDNFDELFLKLYMQNIFPFRYRGLKEEYLSTPSRLDLIIHLRYTYNKKELNVLQKIIDSMDIEEKPSIKEVCKFLLLYTINSFAKPIQEVFGRPFAFMPQGVKVEENDDKTISVIVMVQGREQ
ncbi:MAG: hypothetical protein ACTSU2_13355 [Promethearchaeota archaeon]